MRKIEKDDTVYGQEYVLYSEALEEIDAMQAEIDRLRRDATSALAAGCVLIRLKRIEGYEDESDELVADAALESINWPSYEVLITKESKESKGAT